MPRQSLWLASLFLLPTLAAVASEPQRAATPSPASAPAATPAFTNTDAETVLADYARRMREAVAPEDVRRACNSPTGSYATEESITVCGEALGQNRYRVPREVAVAPKAEDMKSPTAKGRALMKSGDGGPVGNTADLGGTGFNPLMFGYYGYKIVEKLMENVREE